MVVSGRGVGDQKMPKSTQCEVKQDGRWTRISVDDALKLDRAVDKRCPECYGPVLPFRAAENGSFGAHMEHRTLWPGCPLGSAFSGERKPHPHALK
jgi:hypothetical protein